MDNSYKLERMEGKRVLILGGLGFIGSNTAQKCFELGADITIFDAMIEPYGFNLKNIEEIREKVDFIKDDMRNVEALSKAVKDKDFIFNCAGQVSHIDSITDPYLDIELNVIANMNLLESCRKFNDNVKIIYAGTRAQTGKGIYFPIDEMHPDNPIDIYGADKLVAEKYLMVYNNVHGIKGTSMRLNTTFGPRHQMKHSLYGVLNWFIRLAMENKTITVFGDGSQLRDYNYIDDAIDAMILGAQSNKANGKVYLLGSTEPIKFIDMVKEIIKECNSGSFELKPFPEDRKAIETGNVEISFKKIKSELGWVPKTSFNDGLKKTINFYKKNLKYYTQ